MRKIIFIIILVIISIAFCYYDYQNGQIGGFSITYKSPLPEGVRPRFYIHAPSCFCFEHNKILYGCFDVNWSWIHPDTCNWDFVAYGYNDTSIIVLLEDSLGNKRYKTSRIDTISYIEPRYIRIGNIEWECQPKNVTRSYIQFQDKNILPKCTYKWIWVKNNYYHIGRNNFLFSILLILCIVVIILYSKSNSTNKCNLCTNK